MDWHGRIVSDPTILVGKPTIAGTRISGKWGQSTLRRPAFRALTPFCRILSRSTSRSA